MLFVLRRLGLAIGLLVAAVASQAPEFAQQYRQRLGGAIDEINRMHPKTQSAFLECMEEKAVSVAGQTFPLPEFHFVIATQNPLEYVGTFLLPEAQKDRFTAVVKI